ncbi:MAG TPA: exodeoxyribonuclease VII small subunit [Candidatus Omnitrophota bacterium]|nr:exodeoxyribonuclease VII small subunit [Candidatus Omnitrophota bacterium]HPT07156.1 exodeoxyribonuclease VII small subunit [Candidatus Omnitrophota bacterium]
MAEIKFEEALKKLEKIVDDLERGDLSLDEALKKYQEGIELSGQCSARLAGAKKKIEILVKNNKGDLEVKPVDEKVSEE